MLLENLPVLVISCLAIKQRPIVVWSDAAYELSSATPAIIGFVVFVPHLSAASGYNPGRHLMTLGKRARRTAVGSFFYAWMVVPDSFMQRFKVKKQYIGQLELLGAVCVYYSWPAIERAAGRKLPTEVIHFIDNSSALCALIKGYSGLPDSARLVYAYHCLLLTVWFEPRVIHMAFVATAANIGDMPTRLEKEHFVDFLSNLDATLIQLELPPLDAWESIGSTS